MLALCCEGLAMYPRFVDELRERVGVDAHFVRGGALHVALDAARFAQLQALADVHRAAGAIVRLLDRVETLAREPLIIGVLSARFSSRMRRRSTTVASGARSSRRVRRSAFVSSASTISQSRPMLDASADCELHAALSMLRSS